MEEIIVYSPQSGTAVPISEVPDQTFSDKILGDGIAIQPSSPLVVAPVSGIITSIADTYHAVCIEGKNGEEVLVHLGIDTVQLKGKGFTCYVEEGQEIRRGDKLIKMNLKLCDRKGYSSLSPCIVVNGDSFSSLTVQTGPVEAGITPVIRLKSK